MGKTSFFFGEAIGSLRRNYFMTIAALVTVLLSMSVLGVVLVFAANVDAMLADLEQRVEITVFLRDTATAEQVEQMQQEIIGWEEVQDSKFISKDEALQRLREDLSDHPEILEALTKNPLPASFEVSLRDPQRVDEVASRFEGREMVEDIRYGRDLAERIFQVTAMIRNVMVVFIVLLGGVSVLLISNTIRLSIYARRKEVEIMKLVGATNWFIRWPFMIEGLLVGVTGAVLAYAIVLLGTDFVIGRIRESLMFLTVPFEAMSPLVLAAVLIGVGALIGVLGSGLGLRRFLNI